MRYLDFPGVRKLSVLMFALLGLAAGTDQESVQDRSLVITELTGQEKPSLRIERESRPIANGGPWAERPRTLLADDLNDSFEYEAIPIEPFPGWDGSKGYGINNSGQVAGRFHNYDGVNQIDVKRQTFLWDPGQGARILPSLYGQSAAWGINDNGLLSGYYTNPDGFRRAVTWDAAAEPVSIVEIGTLTNASTGAKGDGSNAYDLNNFGQVTGLADIPNDAGDFTPFHAFIYQETTGIQDLGTFDTQWPEYQYGYSISYDVNGNGQVVGIAHNSSWQFRPFIYDATGGMRELNRDMTYGPNEWYAAALNDSGLIGGHVIAAEDQSLPYYWLDESADPLPLSMPVEYPYGEIYGMNASGVMVGTMWNDSGEEHAFMFDISIGLTDLNDLIDPLSGWVLWFARDINDAGQIAGSGERYGVSRGFVLGPVSSFNRGRISGSVIDLVAELPVEGIRVKIVDTSGVPVSEEYTGADGSYTSTLLAPGSYFAVTSNTLGYIDELYSRTSCNPRCDPTSGTPITVTAGATTIGISFVLEQGGTISGLVTDAATGQPSPGVYVDFYDSGGSWVSTSWATDLTGIYTSKGLPPGTYYAKTFNRLGYVNELFDNIACINAACDVTSGTPISVSVGTVTTGVDFALDLGGRISGTVIDDTSGITLDNIKINIWDTGGSWVTVGTTDFTGTYTSDAGLPTGTYYGVTENSLGYGDEIYDGFACSGECDPTTGTTISVTEGSTVTGIDFALPYIGQPSIMHLAIDFGAGIGLYLFDGVDFERLTPSDPENLVAWGDQLAVDFGGLGLYLYDSTGWTRITSFDPSNVVAWEDKLAVSFTGLGLYLYDSTGWTRITPTDPYDVVAWGDKLALAFIDLGLYLYDSTGWTRITPTNPYDVVAWGDKLAVSFTDLGLYLYDSTGWTRITPTDPYDVVAWGDKLAVDFGGLGLYHYDSTDWTRITPSDPENLVSCGNKLAVDFGSYYLRDDTGWKNPTTSDPQLMINK